VSLLAPGTRLKGRYVIERVVGQGGFAVVYAAADEEFEGSKVAVKQLQVPAGSPEDRAAMIEQFQREAQILRSLKHDHIPRVYGCFVEGGQQYLVMDLLEGKTLDHYVDLDNPSGTPRFVPPVLNVLDWSIQVCHALIYLHDRKPRPVIHKDIKPQNLMLTADGIMLLDFGIAKALDVRGRYNTVMEGVATPGYAAPEMYLAANPSDPSVDLYALGATMYALLTGRTPPESILRQVDLVAGRTDPLQPVSSVRADVPSYVEGAMQRLLEVRRDERFATALAANRSLATCLVWVRQGRAG
jgi:serine/threonine protein kinase